MFIAFVVLEDIKKTIHSEELVPHAVAATSLFKEDARELT